MSISLKYSNNENRYVGVPVDPQAFPDGSLHLTVPNVYITPRSIIWRYENDAELFTIICLKKHYGEALTTLIMPYIPHARMDRVQEPEDVFTLKYFCEIINSLNFQEVVVTDPHSNVSLALLDRVQQVSIKDYINQTACCIIDRYDSSAKNLVLFFPDAGAMKRYSGCINFPYAFGLKKREWKTGKIQSLQIINSEVVKGKDILIIDDICSRGGTFLRSAKALKEAGAKDIYLYVTHAENTIVEGEMYNDPTLIKRIFTTDSIFNPELDVRHKVSIVGGK